MPIDLPSALARARSLGIVLPEVYQELPEEYRRLAFTASGLHSIDQIQMVFDSLVTAMEENLTFPQWRERVIASPANIRLPSNRLETIFRNFVQTSYNRGRFEQYVQGQAEQPWLLYVSVDDARTRPTHAAMNGHVARVNDPIWNRWAPPNGHNCRCRLIALDNDQAQEFIELDERVLNSDATRAGRLNAIAEGPDNGWGFNAHVERQRAINEAVTQRFSQGHRRRDGRTVPFEGFLTSFLVGLATQL